MHKVQAQDLISVDDFEKIRSSTERARIIAKAPPVQKAELGRIDTHLALLQSYGSEENLKVWKEGAVAKARGFSGLERISSDYLNLWSYYINSVMDADKKSGMTDEQWSLVGKKLWEERTVDVAHIESIHSLVFSLAPTPQAFQLEKKVETMREEFARQMGEDGSNSHPPLRKENLIEAGKQLDRLVAELKQLPQLTSAQTQKEYDDFPEEKMRGW